MAPVVIAGDRVSVALVNIGSHELGVLTSAELNIGGVVEVLSVVIDGASKVSGDMDAFAGEPVGSIVHFATLEDDLELLFERLPDGEIQVTLFAGEHEPERFSISQTTFLEIAQSFKATFCKPVSQ
jgi:hypothetical protein